MELDADGGCKCLRKLYVYILIVSSSLTVMRGLAQKNYVDPRKVESELVPALNYNYSRNMTPVLLEMKQGTFC